MDGSTRSFRSNHALDIKRQQRTAPPAPHATRVNINIPPLIHRTFIVPPIIERYPKILKWGMVACAVPGALLCRDGHYLPGVALLVAACGLCYLDAFTATFIAEPRHRFRVIEVPDGN